MHFSKISIFCFLIFLTACAQNSQAPDSRLTGQDVVDRIQQQVSGKWKETTVDTFKEGDPNQAVTGIATTFLATLDVLKQAKAKGLNLIITHEPTYYNHLDNVEDFIDDPVYEAKKKFIQDNQLMVFRFHDHWHRTRPDGIHTGIVKDLDWEKHQLDDDVLIFRFPQTKTLGTMARELAQHYQTSAIRVVGDADNEFQTYGLVVGAPGSGAQIDMLRQAGVEVLIIGETHEWETVEYMRDALSEGQKKGLIILGHANSEEAGMAYCAEWMKGFVSEVPVVFIAAGDPFWTPEF
ncbi:MAG: Nif3-like dinuclear metal center hexameric protein [Bacteroidota bacterium]